MDGQDLCRQIKQGKYGDLRLVLLLPVGKSLMPTIPSDGLLNKPLRALQLRYLLLDLLSPKTEKKTKRWLYPCSNAWDTRLIGAIKENLI
jgi:hypothetical protein